MIGLVLQGGGARGSYHVGAVKALLKKNIKFDTVVGTSIGAINGALIASNEIILLEKLWEKLNTESVFGIKENSNKFLWDKFNVNLENVHKFINSKGIDINILRNLLNENIDEEKLRKSKVNFGLTTYNITDKKTVEIFKKDIPKGKMIDYLLASAYLPIFKMEKIIDNKYYLDGGCFNNCPLSMLNISEYEKIYIIKIYKNEAVDKEYRKENTVIISPNCNLGSQIDFNSEITHYNIKLGYYDTLRVLNKLDGINYYIRPKSEKYYQKLFDEKEKKKNLFETNIYKNVNEKKIIIKIIESLAKEFKINQFKIYSISALITLLKFKMNNKKEHKYYKFIKCIKII